MAKIDEEEATQALDLLKAMGEAYEDELEALRSSEYSSESGAT
jgi:hydrogenase maturation factor